MPQNFFVFINTQPSDSKGRKIRFIIPGLSHSPKSEQKTPKVEPGVHYPDGSPFPRMEETRFRDEHNYCYNNDNYMQTSDCMVQVAEAIAYAPSNFSSASLPSTSFSQVVHTL